MFQRALDRDYTCLKVKEICPELGSPVICEQSDGSFALRGFVGWISAPCNKNSITGMIDLESKFNWIYDSFSHLN